MKWPWFQRLIWPHGIRCFLYWCPPWHQNSPAWEERRAERDRLA